MFRILEKIKLRTILLASLAVISSMIVTAPLGFSTRTGSSDPDPYCNNANLTQSYCSLICQSNGANCPADPDPSPKLQMQSFVDQLPLTIGFACANFGGNRNFGSFAVNLTGRDPGSTYVSWNFFSNGPSFGIEIFLYGPNANESTFCNGNVNTALGIVTTQTLSIRILASGTYTFIGTASCSLNCGNYSPVVTESWTVTTIS